MCLGGRHSKNSGRFCTQCKAFVPLAVLGSYLKPHSALSTNRYHGLWADEDSFGEDDDQIELCFGAFFDALKRSWFSLGVQNGLQRPMCLESARSAVVSSEVTIDV